jgi:hypothetical protein
MWHCFLTRCHTIGDTEVRHHLEGQTFAGQQGSYDIEEFDLAGLLKGVPPRSKSLADSKYNRILLNEHHCHLSLPLSVILFSTVPYLPATAFLECS